LISVLNEEYPVYSFSSRVLSLAKSSGFKVYTSPLCLAITFYYAEKKNKRNAREKINSLADKLTITSIDEKTVSETVKNKQIHDFEDGLQYYSAVESGCKCIITEDKTGFYFSKIEVLTSRAFLENHVF
jgi:predicted nucleic acid-binding protein